MPDGLGAALDETRHRLEEAQTSVVSGEVRRSLVSHRIKTKPKIPRVPDQPRLKRTPVRPANFVPCPQGCGAQLNPRRIGRHLKKIHGIAPIYPEQDKNQIEALLAPTEVGDIYTICTACGVKVRKDRLSRHMAKAHRRPRTLSTAIPRNLGIVKKRHEVKTAIARPGHSMISKIYSSPYPAPRSFDTAPTKNGNSSRHGHKYTLCPVCRTSVKTTRLKKHMAKVHKRRFVRSRPTQAPSAKDPTRRTTSLTAPRDQNLDATKPYAHAYREQGKYGSHPSHDGFDDESSPD